MALKMAQPWPHPKTGVFWYRRAVPKDLRELVGKREELVTLGTKDAAEARVEYAKVSAQVEVRWSNLRAGYRSLTEREAHEYAKLSHDNWLNGHADDPRMQLTWRTHLYADLWTKDLRTDGKTVVADDIIRDFMRRFCHIQTDNCLAHFGLRVDDLSYFKLSRAIAAAFQRASLKLDQLAEGIIDPGDVATTKAAHVSPAEQPRFADTAIKPLSVTGLFESWWQEAKAAGRKPSTHESYHHTVKGFVAFLGHDDATRVTPDDVVAFKDHRLTTPSQRTGKIPSAKTVKDSDLSALKTIFGWAKINRKLAENPAEGVTIRVGKKPQLRPKGFTDDEANAILSAALNYEPIPRELPSTAAAKHWIPWLCAFSGARVGEIGQLRRQDIRFENGFWVLRITPDAGTVKTNQARDIVLHPQLIDLGFHLFVEAAQPGPLFVVPGKNGDVAGPLSGLLNRMREFVRDVVPDPNVQPNHGWRHLFTTRCIDAEIEARIYNAIQGHAARTVADQYGDVTLKAKAMAIRKLPRFEVDEHRR
ncbi:DUF6538 domain-containing protein [Notoacmeibacter ruber]|uniref:Integrase n=1 Tax=Notoacmeibacter ruber TaxID=2670375 RepID=A0A3L7J2Y6_9HYPH|nr:DUF6538 domain-containing protein [Notoacmeibacter ruber]RLQ84844.1 hypothetical protein D8780_15645 [Notoacmeibacter ruber]